MLTNNINLSCKEEHLFQEWFFIFSYPVKEGKSMDELIMPVYEYEPAWSFHFSDEEHEKLMIKVFIMSKTVCK